MPVLINILALVNLVNLIWWLAYPGVKDISSLNRDTTLAELGLDSLMGVEVKQTLERDYDLVLAMREIRQLTVNKLMEIAFGSSPNPVPETKTGEEPGSVLEKRNTADTTTTFDVSRVLPTETLVTIKEGPVGEKPLFVIHPIEGRVF